MRKLLFNRYTVLLLLGLAAYNALFDIPEASAGLLVMAAVVWPLAGCPKLFRLPFAKDRHLIAKVAVRPSWGARENDLAGCFNRLDPAWQLWLRASGGDTQLDGSTR